MMVISGGSYNGNNWSAMYDPFDQYADMVTDKYYAIMGICDGKEGEPAQEKPKNWFTQKNWTSRNGIQT